MSYLYLLLAMMLSGTITVCGRIWQERKRANVSGLYNMIVPASAALTWLVCWCCDFSFDIRVLPYSLLYGFSYTGFTVGMLGALKTGSTAVTALVKQLALVGVSFWGFFFWDTPFTLVSGVGILLIVVSLVLCLISKEQSGSRDFLRWCFFAVMITVGNAGCSIVQRYQQMAFEYRHRYMFMFFGLLFASVVCSLMALREEKSNWGEACRRAWFLPAASGASSAVCNVCILILIRRQMSPVIIYPGVAVGGLMFTTLVSLLYFRDRLRPAQWWGLAAGAVALVLLNL